MKKVLLFLWQLPQNLLGLLAVFFFCKVYQGKHEETTEDGISYWSTQWSFGVSLGRFIIGSRDYFTNKYGDKDFFMKHEYGHTWQSRLLGPLYLLVIGIPSALGNIWDRLAHTKWTKAKRREWYYNQPWEKGANRLGGIE